jgi:dihydroflavonol-4-reductase
LNGGYNFVDVRDLATGIRRAADRGRSGNCYILSGHEITVKELLDHLASFSGRKQVRTKLAYWFILAMSYFAEAFYLVVKRKPLFTHYSIVVLHSNYAFDNDKAKRELDFILDRFGKPFKTRCPLWKQTTSTKRANASASG